MKTCEKCGAQLDDNATFCTGCGAKTAQAGASSKTTGGLNKTALIGIFAAAAVLVVLLIVLLVNLLGGYKKPIKAYFKAANASTAQDKSYLLPAQFEKRNYKYSFEIKDKEKIDKDDLEDLADIFDDKYDEEYKFSKGYVVEVKAVYENKEEDEKSKNDMYFIVVKKGLKWYYYSSGSMGDEDLEDIIDKVIE